MPHIVVSTVVKQRLEAMRRRMVEVKGRKSVTYSEVLEALIAEHDKARETETA